VKWKIIFQILFIFLIVVVKKLLKLFNGNQRYCKNKSEMVFSKHHIYVKNAVDCHLFFCKLSLIRQ